MCQFPFSVDRFLFKRIKPTNLLKYEEAIQIMAHEEASVIPHNLKRRVRTPGLYEQSNTVHPQLHGHDNIAHSGSTINTFQPLRQRKKLLNVLEWLNKVK